MLKLVAGATAPKQKTIIPNRKNIRTVKKINKLVKLISARLSGEGNLAEQDNNQQLYENPRSARSAPEDPEAANRYIDRQLADAARKVWCSAGHSELRCPAAVHL